MNKVFLRAFAVGAIVWFVATIGLRLGGQWVLLPGARALTGAFVAGLVIMAVAGPLLRRRVSRDPADAAMVAVGLILPGMFGDCAASLAFGHVYPNLSPMLGRNFAALALWYYAVGALAIMLQASLTGGSHAGIDDGRSGRDRRGDRDQGVARAA